MLPCHAELTFTNILFYEFQSNVQTITLEISKLEALNQVVFLQLHQTSFALLYLHQVKHGL
jgi:hypothetical protein